MSLINGGYELTVPVNTIFKEKALNGSNPLAVNFCSLKSLSSLDGSGTLSAAPSVLKAHHATSPNFLASSALVTLYKML